YWKSAKPYDTIGEPNPNSTTANPFDLAPRGLHAVTNSLLAGIALEFGKKVMKLPDDRAIALAEIVSTYSDIVMAVLGGFAGSAGGRRELGVLGGRSPRNRRFGGPSAPRPIEQPQFSKRGKPERFERFGSAAEGAVTQA